MSQSSKSASDEIQDVNYRLGVLEAHVLKLTSKKDCNCSAIPTVTITISGTQISAERSEKTSRDDSVLGTPGVEKSMQSAKSSTDEVQPIFIADEFGYTEKKLTEEAEKISSVESENSSNGTKSSQDSSGSLDVGSIEEGSAESAEEVEYMGFGEEDDQSTRESAHGESPPCPCEDCPVRKTILQLTESELLDRMNDRYGDVKQSVSDIEFSESECSLNSADLTSDCEMEDEITSGSVGEEEAPSRLITAPSSSSSDSREIVSEELAAEVADLRKKLNEITAENEKLSEKLATKTDMAEFKMAVEEIEKSFQTTLDDIEKEWDKKMEEDSEERKKIEDTLDDCLVDVELLQDEVKRAKKAMVLMAEKMAQQNAIGGVGRLVSGMNCVACGAGITMIGDGRFQAPIKGPAPRLMRRFPGTPVAGQPSSWSLINDKLAPRSGLQGERHIGGRHTITDANQRIIRRGNFANDYLKPRK